MPDDLVVRTRLIGRVVGKSDKQPKPKHRAASESAHSDKVALGDFAAAAALFPPPDLRGIRGCARLNASHREAVLAKMCSSLSTLLANTSRDICRRTQNGQDGTNRSGRARVRAQREEITALPIGRRQQTRCGRCTRQLAGWQSFVRSAAHTFSAFGVLETPMLHTRIFFRTWSLIKTK